MKTIRQLRAERDWSQLDVAVRLGASVNTVYKWERGVARPRRKYQQRLTDLFGVSVEAIAFGPAEPVPQERP
jgi:transcriptional regulator with XRE-family HTH domain